VSFPPRSSGHQTPITPGPLSRGHVRTQRESDRFKRKRSCSCDREATGSRSNKSRKGPQERRLTSTIGPDQSVNSAPLDLKVNRMEHPGTTLRRGQTFDSERVPIRRQFRSRSDRCIDRAAAGVHATNYKPIELARALCRLVVLVEIAGGS